MLIDSHLCCFCTDPFISKVDCLMESQLFKLYHNEQEASHLTSELRGKSRETEKLEGKKQTIEQQLKVRRQENAKLTREMATIERTIRERVKMDIDVHGCTWWTLMGIDAHDGHWWTWWTWMHNMHMDAHTSRCTWMTMMFYYFQEVALNEKRPAFIKAKEKTSHVIKRLETSK